MLFACHDSLLHLLSLRFFFFFEHFLIIRMLNLSWQRKENAGCYLNEEKLQVLSLSVYVFMTVFWYLKTLLF